MADDAKSNQKSYHKKATGAALATVKKHTKEHDLKLYGSCFWSVAPPWAWLSRLFTNVP